MKVKIKNTGSNPLPEYKTIGSSGMDLYSNLSGHLDDYILLLPKNSLVISTGISIELPEGFEAQIRPRSGLSLRGIMASFGTIDSDYRGEIKVNLINCSRAVCVIKKGDRIAQLVIAPVTRVEWEQVEDLTETERGINGFGSTGV